MFTKEQRERMRQELLASFRPQPPPPKPTRSAQLEERGANRPDEAIMQDAAKSAEAQVEMARRWRRDRRQEQLAKELAELNHPRVRYQAELDRWWQLQRDFADALDDGYVNVGGFRERRRPTCHRGPGDPDWGLK
jgi:hypothetical protein